MDSQPDQWPLYGREYRDHFHAIGVLISNWAEVERAYQAFIQFVFGADAALALRVNELLGNEGRWTLIREECARRAGPQFEEHIAFFLKCAAICKENRNAVAHAQYMPNADPALITLHKGRDRAATKIRSYAFSVEAIRAMADETHAVALYGLHLWGLMEADRAERRNPGSLPAPIALAARASLLGKPRQPRKWDQRSQPKTQDAPHPPQSSGA